jgi:hypothetical protein
MAAIQYALFAINSSLGIWRAYGTGYDSNIYAIKLWVSSGAEVPRRPTEQRDALRMVGLLALNQESDRGCACVRALSFRTE